MRARRVGAWTEAVCGCLGLREVACACLPRLCLSEAVIQPTRLLLHSSLSCLATRLHCVHTLSPPCLDRVAAAPHSAVHLASSTQSTRTHATRTRKQALLTILPRATGEGDDESPDYYTPAGLGKVVCTVCHRIFLNAGLLHLHCQSYAHRVLRSVSVPVSVSVSVSSARVSVRDASLFLSFGVGAWSRRRLIRGCSVTMLWDLALRSCSVIIHTGSHGAEAAPSLPLAAPDVGRGLAPLALSHAVACRCACHTAVPCFELLCTCTCKCMCICICMCMYTCMCMCM